MEERLRSPNIIFSILSILFFSEGEHEDDVESEWLEVPLECPEGKGPPADLGHPGKVQYGPDPPGLAPTMIF